MKNIYIYIYCLETYWDLEFSSLASYSIKLDTEEQAQTLLVL